MMAIQKNITKCLAVLFVLSFITLGNTQDSNAGIDPLPIEPGCCQYGLKGGELTCFDSLGGLCKIPPGETSFDGFFEGESCNKDTGLCSGINKINEVPTLSEWGLIAMAGVLGLIGFMVARRRKAAT